MKNTFLLFAGLFFIGCLSMSQRVIIPTETESADQSWLLAHSYASQYDGSLFVKEDYMFDFLYNRNIYLQFIKEPTRIIVMMYYKARPKEEVNPEVEDLKNKIVNYITDKSLYRKGAEKQVSVQTIEKEAEKTAPAVEKKETAADKSKEKKNESKKVNSVDFL